MTKQRLFIFFCTCLITGSALADPGAEQYLAKNKVLCDVEKIACVRATVTYNQGTRALSMRGRVTRAKKEGTLQFIFRPAKIDEDVCPTRTFDVGPQIVRLDIPISGNASEVVDEDEPTGYPMCITEWKLCCAIFCTDEDPPVRCLPAECTECD